MGETVVTRLLMSGPRQKTIYLAYHKKKKKSQEKKKKGVRDKI